MEQLKNSFPVVQALGLADSAHSLEISTYKEQCESEASKCTSQVSLCCFLLEGSGKKAKIGKQHRFTTEQKELMENCFDVGENDKRKHYTSQSCQALMQQQLGKDLTLTEHQIVSYWGAYKRRKRTQ